MKTKHQYAKYVSQHNSGTVFEFHDLRIHREEKEIISLKDGLYFCQIDKTQPKLNSCQRFGFDLPSSGHKLLLKT